MEEAVSFEQIIRHISLSMGAAWASGLNLYATVCILGVLGATGDIALPPELQVLSSPGVIAAAGFMYLVEFIADKVPAFDTLWDSIHTFIRIPAGAILAAQAMAPVGPEAMVVAGILGGTLAAGSHAAKAGARALINTSPEPVTNWVASVTEDVMVLGGMYAALHFPWVFLAGLTVFILLLLWLLPKLWRGVCAVSRTIRRWVSGNASATADAADIPPIHTPAWAMRARRKDSPTPAPSAAGSSAAGSAAGTATTFLAAPEAPAPDIRRKLDELKALHDEGRLTRKEYEAMRAKLLESLL